MPALLLNKYVLYAIALAALAAALLWSIHTVYQDGFDTATIIVEAKYAARDKAAEATAQTKIRTLEQARIGTERAHSASLNQISVKFQQDASNAQTQIAALRRDVAAGKRVFVDPGRANTSSGGCLPGVTAGAGERDAASGSEVSVPPAGSLSAVTTAFLIELAGDADAIAGQLSACQAVIRSDREKP